MSPRSGEGDSKLLLCVKALSPASWLAHYSSFGIYAKMLQTNSIFNSNLNENIKSKTKLGIFIQNNSGWHSCSGIYAKKLEKNFAPARNVEFADERTFERSSPHSWWIWITKQNIAGVHLIKTQPIDIIVYKKKKSKIRMEISMLLIIIVCNNNNGKLQTATGHLFQLLSLA